MLSKYAVTGQLMIFPLPVFVGEIFTVDQAIICKLGRFFIQRHNELRDLEDELLNTVCSNVKVELILQQISGKQVRRGGNLSQAAKLDIHARGFWEHKRSAFLADVRVCQPNAESYRDLGP